MGFIEIHYSSRGDCNLDNHKPGFVQVGGRKQGEWRCTFVVVDQTPAFDRVQFHEFLKYTVTVPMVRIGQKNCAGLYCSVSIQNCMKHIVNKPTIFLSDCHRTWETNGRPRSNNLSRISSARLSTFNPHWDYAVFVVLEWPGLSFPDTRRKVTSKRGSS
jgi:hypothetical protein